MSELWGRLFGEVACCWPKDEQEMRRINSEIERQIRKDKQELRRNYKVLLLGAGESGKSTFVRNLRVVHGSGFSTRERQDAREVILSNLVITVYSVLCQMELTKEEDKKLQKLAQLLYQHLDSSELKEVSQYVYELVKPPDRVTVNERKDNPIDTLVDKKEEKEGMDKVQLLKKIGQNEVFREVIRSLAIYKLPDSATYFLAHWERVLAEGFLPRGDDIVRMRMATSGVCETVLPFGDVNFRLVDVGGQRSERRKWIHCFEDVSSIIFIASLAEYNLTLVEDSSVNRLEESIALFRTILKNPWLMSSSMILFLNKKDVFYEKIQYFHLRDSFPAYNGNYCDPIEAKEFILEMFAGAGRRHRSAIYSHVTVATDPDNVKFVFAAVKHTILSGIVDEIFNSSNDI